MQQQEFDQFADEYAALHATNIRLSGEAPDFFARYKIAELATLWKRAGTGDPAPRLLDFGTGVGNSIPHLRHFFPQSRPVGIDISQRSLEVAEHRFPGAAELIAFDGSTVPLPAGTIDMAFAACVFHHIEHDLHVGLLAEIRRVLRPGGLMVVFEHNPLNPLTVHAVNTCPFDRNARLIRPWKMRDRLKQAGYAPLELTFRLFFPAALAPLRRLEPGLGWLPLGAQYYVVGRKPA